MMDDPISRGLPFELADIWRKSMLHVEHEERSLFAPLEASFPVLDLDIHAKHSELEHALVIPPLDNDNGTTEAQHLDAPESDIASSPFELWDTGQSAHEPSVSVWDLDLNLDLPPPRPRIHTWEAFEKREIRHAEHTAYLSEAGSSALDAVLGERAGKSSGVLPQDVMLKALCNLALGRASAFFLWDDQKGLFHRTLADVSVSGCSLATSGSLIDHLMDYAARYRSLRSSCANVRQKRTAKPCVVSFNGCAASMLDAIEDHITNQLPQIRSILQLQALVTQPHELLTILDRIGKSVRQASSDEAVISALSDHVCESVSADSSSGAVMRVLLERTSVPWLEQLAVDVGLNGDLIAPVSPQNDEDTELYAAELASSLATDHPQRDVLPAFMNDADRVLVQETKASLRTLRKTQPDYVCNQEAQKLFRSALGWESNRRAELDGSNVATLRNSHDRTNATTTAEADDPAWADVETQHDFLDETDRQMSDTPCGTRRQEDSLQAAVLLYCLASEYETNLAKSLTFDLSPLDRLRPALTAQHAHLNRTLLYHLFANGLVHHLRLQHSFHLLHSGEFITRLSIALFSTDTQSAERKRGSIPTGQTMGLRLGTRAEGEQRWPPASSELRLTLMDVLAESYTAEHPSPSEKESKASKGALPGGLSFSIRELPEHEIERVLDPSSIYALDFLRLQYLAPAPLDAILTMPAMTTYDAIFRHLLRLLRALHVSTSLQREVANRHRQHALDPSAASRTRFARQAHAFATALLAHTMDVGIAAPWRHFMRQLERIEVGLRSDGAGSPAVGVETLKTLHTTCLSAIRGRLFLRRKQEKVMRAVEEVLSAVLRGAATSETDSAQGMREAMERFEQAATALLVLLRGTVDKPPKMEEVNAVDDRDDDIETTRALLGKLDPNGFYHDRSTASNRNV